jgi:hypothetical protein
MRDLARPDRLPGPTPIARWDDDASADGLVWWAQLDERYLVEVLREAPDRAALRIFDHADGDRLLASHPVVLTGDGRSGPAIGDVVAWQRLAIETVDGPAPSEDRTKETTDAQDHEDDAGDTAHAGREGAATHPPAPAG